MSVPHPLRTYKSMLIELFLICMKLALDAQIAGVSTWQYSNQQETRTTHSEIVGELNNREYDNSIQVEWQ